MPADDALDRGLEHRLAFLQYVQDGIVVTTPAGNVVYMNPVARRLFRVSDGSAAARSLLEYASADGDVRTLLGNPISDHERPLLRALRGEEYRDVEVLVERADHGAPQVLVFSSATMATEPPLQVITIRDESERWLAERRFRATFETDPAPSVVARLGDMAVVLANSGMADMTGFDMAEMTSLTLRDIELFSAGVLAEAVHALQQGVGIHKARDRLRHASGTDIDVLVSARGMELEGQACGVFTFVDITELEEARRSRDAEQEELAFVRSRLRERREEQRSRLARELHDGVLQRLLALSTDLGLEQRRRQEEDDDRTAAVLRGYRESVLQSVAELRSTIRGFRPTALRHLGLWASLQGAIPEARAEESPKIWFPRSPEPGLPDEVLLVLYHVALEATRNAVKHADAQNVEVLLEADHDEVRLIVRDDGRGFDVPKRLWRFVQDDHFGLATMHEDLAALGGDLEVTSVPGEGTRLVCRVPLNAASIRVEDSET